MLLHWEAKLARGQDQKKAAALGSQEIKGRCRRKLITERCGSRQAPAYNMAVMKISRYASYEKLT